MRVTVTFESKDKALLNKIVAEIIQSAQSAEIKHKGKQVELETEHEDGQLIKAIGTFAGYSAQPLDPRAIQAEFDRMAKLEAELEKAKQEAGKSKLNSNRFADCWTETGVYCYKTGQNCLNCNLAAYFPPGHLGNNCKVPEAVQTLLQRGQKIPEKLLARYETGFYIGGGWNEAK